ncbi:dihydroorotase [Rhodothalassium salexigens DSM 2132]|uniref:Dihydroorotase n=1 Tax=Rhodothalassium salexigens DSM 2132 TaxID=1188247 RepID=A0A4R2PE29_RHOSA|nr:dihydroorotase [Rhodothalassium salexigens]MBB4211937.1 dihydroorotase [Rhodothalassium salexigens DSM 2132]MBK1639255.1 dihydroorotase [Rhodothalassium salexigens DSM 2132]TCP33479.1 dihydroorotase [Rhodothalassium salexigens DSM 2132]
MTPAYDLIVRGGRVVNHAGRAVTDIAIKDERIAAIGDLRAASAAEEIDAAGLTVLPGVIDTQVHFREPGNEHKEDLETGSRAAVMGGVTAVFEMPNTSPLTTTPAALEDKVTRATGRMHCDFAFYMGAMAGNADEMAALEALPGCCGVKIFMGASTGDLLVPDDATLERVLAHGRRRVAIHCEDEPRMNEREGERVPGDPASHPVWRDEETAFKATRRAVAMARKTGRRIHVLHVTTAEEMAFLADNKDIASVETTPQHLTLADETAYPALGTLAQMNPPIRGAAHQAGLWAAVANGVVDVIGSDHAPHTREEKAKPYPQSPSGMPGVQTLLPLLLDHMNAGRLTLERLVDLTSHGANRLFNLRDKGRLAVGYHGDLTVVDLSKQWTVTEDWLASRCGWSPFTGMVLTGKPVGTIVRGRRVMWEDELLTPSQGQAIRFQETLAADR